MLFPPLTIPSDEDVAVETDLINPEEVADVQLNNLYHLFEICYTIHFVSNLIFQTFLK